MAINQLSPDYRECVVTSINAGLDMIMEPGIDGLETYRRILKAHPEQRAVIASGYSETQRVAQALKLGAACYLKKPYTLLQMAKTAKKALR